MKRAQVVVSSQQPAVAFRPRILLQVAESVRLRTGPRDGSQRADHLLLRRRAGDPARKLCALPALRGYRSDRNAARSSSEKSCGSSQAAKWPPLAAWLK